MNFIERFIKLSVLLSLLSLAAACGGSGEGAETPKPDTTAEVTNGDDGSANDDTAGGDADDAGDGTGGDTDTDDNSDNAGDAGDGAGDGNDDGTADDSGNTDGGTGSDTGSDSNSDGDDSGSGTSGDDTTTDTGGDDSSGGDTSTDDSTGDDTTGDDGTGDTGDGDTGTDDTSSSVPDLALTFTTPPINLQGAAANFAADIAYGEGARNFFDIFLPDLATPTPLVIYMHGGAFVGGDKAEDYALNAPDIRRLLNNGIAYASINYRLLTSEDTEGGIVSLRSSQRALQFMRYQAENLNIDPDRIALMGNSAGAGTALWLAFGDDRADADNSDPVLQQSTRVSAAVALETQATYDMVRWETDVFEPFGITLQDLADEGLLVRILRFNAVSSLAELNTQESQDYRANIDMLGLMSSDDPEFFIRNANPNIGSDAPTDQTSLFHHPRHAMVLFERASDIGLANRSYIPSLGVEDPSNETVTSFLIRKLQ